METTFTPTADQIEAVEKLLVAYTNRAFIEPMVNTYQSHILAQRQFHIGQEWVAKGEMDMIITDPEMIPLLGPEDRKTFWEDCKAARDALGLQVDHDDHCPFIAACGAVQRAEWAVLDAMSTVPGFDGLSKLRPTDEASRKSYGEAIEASVDLVKPHCRKPEAILADWSSKTKASLARPRM
jgi:hypothetical protein